MNLLSVLKPILQTVGTVTGIGVFKDAADAIGGDEMQKLPPETQAALEASLEKHEEAMRGFDTEDLKTVVSEAVAEIASPDKFTSRARPFCVYCAGVLTLSMGGAMMFGVRFDTGAMVTLMTPLWGNSMYYVYQRTQEKLAKSQTGTP